MRQVIPMVIKAKFENGVFRPLEKVRVKEGTEADVYLRPVKRSTGQVSEQPRKSVKESSAFGIWKNREDIGDGIEFVNRMRNLRK